MKKKREGKWKRRKQKKITCKKNVWENVIGGKKRKNRRKQGRGTGKQWMWKTWMERFWWKEWVYSIPELGCRTKTSLNIQRKKIWIIKMITMHIEKKYKHYSLHRGTCLPKRGLWACNKPVWEWGFDSGDLKSVEYLSIAITSRLTLTRNIGIF